MVCRSERQNRFTAGILRVIVVVMITVSAFLPPSSRHLAVYAAEVPTAAGVQVNSDDELVYLDADGVIKVFDPQLSVGVPEVQWQSPSGGWNEIALGDFNADGDDEIVAISSQGTNRLVIFDPVAEGIDSGDADGLINGIPWKQLYAETLSGPPLLVATGNFDANSPADEIIYYYKLPSGDVVQDDDPYRFVLLSAQGTPPDGSSWSTILTHDSGNVWDKIVPGNYDGAGVDEVALIASTTGNLSVYRLANGGLDRIRRTVNVETEWQDAASGQFVSGGREELALGREADYPYPTLLVSHYVTTDDWPDDFSQHYNPPPRTVFMGDISGNGDDEVVALRDVPSNQAGKPRLFVRDNGNDTVGIGELSLDADNGYQAGVAADIDGDGRDEIVVMRNNRIRMFTEPEKSANFQDEEVSTGSQVILAGNLDAGGLTDSSRFGVSPSSVTDSVVSGSVSDSHVLAITDVANGSSIPFTARVEDSSTWLDLSPASSNTPGTIDVVLDATDLISGTFTDRVIIDTTDASVVNAPYAIDVSMTVVPGVAVSPSEIVAVDLNCGDGGSPAEFELSVQGTEDATFTISQQTTANWASVSPVTGTIPSQVTVTLDGGELGSGAGKTEFVVRAETGNEVAIARVDAYLLCAESTVHLPFMTH